MASLLNKEWGVEYDQHHGQRPETSETSVGVLNVNVCCGIIMFSH